MKQRSLNFTSSLAMRIGLSSRLSSHRDEDVARHAGDVLLDQGRAVGDVVEPVRRQQVLQLQAVDARGVRLLDVEVVGVLVDAVDDPDPERQRVAEAAEVDPVDVEVVHDRQVAVDLQQRVDVLEVDLQRLHLVGRIEDRLPQGVAPVRVREGQALPEVFEPRVRDRKLQLAPEPREISRQRRADRVARLPQGAAERASMPAGSGSSGVWSR